MNSMPLRVSEKRVEQILRQVHEEAEAKRSIASRLYPNLAKTKSTEHDETKRGPVDGWSHLRKQERDKR
jgi:hypothetical protein